MNTTSKRLALDVLAYVVRAGWKEDQATFVHEAVIAGAGRQELLQTLQTAHRKPGDFARRPLRAEAVGGY